MSATIAQSYGLPAAVLGQRMAAGRFRVKSGIDQKTAQLLAADLVKKGATCSIADESGAVIARLPQAAPAPTPAPHYESSLQAAFAGQGGGDPDIGALGALGSSTGGLSLATLDGQDAGHDANLTDNSDEPTRPAVSLASFAPPAAQEQPLHLVDVPGVVPKASVVGQTAQSRGDEVAFISDRPPPAPQAQAPGPSGPPDRRSAHQLPRPSGTVAPPAPGAAHSAQDESPSGASHHARGGVAMEDSAFDRVRTQLADRERVRFAVGVFAALLIGWLPAALYAQSGHGDLDDLRSAMRAEQELARGNLDAWNLLDDRRAAVLIEMESTQRNIAVGGLLIWALCSGALAFLWFGKIDWQFYQTPPGAPRAQGPPAGALARG